MCGIVGLAYLDGRTPEEGLLRRMADTLAHRGPDDAGALVAGSVGLSHRRLAIIDLVTGHQPMTVEGVSIVFNGEIYNYVELRAELASRGHRFTTASDTEVILRLYLDRGPDAFHGLNGIFAFVIHDPRRGILVAARDHLGVKPLYRHQGAGLVAYASEIKALLAHPGVTAEPDYDAVREYLTFQFVLGERTLFRDVDKVLPGTFETVNLATGGRRTTRYWEPTFAVDDSHTEQYFVSRLRELLADAVRLQLRSDVPVGAHLSGGMDSSVITLLAARAYGSGLKAFTGWFREGPEFDEREYARAVANVAGVELLDVAPDGADLPELLPRLIYHMDEPAGGPGLIPQYAVSRLAAAHVKVVLGGQGGDEVYGGYVRYIVAYLEQALKGAIFETNEEQQHIVSLSSILPNLPYLRSYGPMVQQFWRSGVFEPMDRRYFRLVDRSGGALSLLSAGFRALYRQDEIFERFQSVFNHPQTLSYFNKMTHFDLVASLPALLQVEDRVSMAVGLESRVPLLDHRIVDLVASVPPAMKFRGAEMKYLLKQATRDLLPERVLTRKDKMGFPVPLHLWVRGEARAFVEDVLLSERARSRGLFDPGELAKLMDHPLDFGRRIWGMLNLELWFRTFMDGQAPEAG